jgi:hypothetical protein
VPAADLVQVQEGYIVRRVEKCAGKHPFSGKIDEGEPGIVGDKGIEGLADAVGSKNSAEQQPFRNN